MSGKVMFSPGEEVPVYLETDGNGDLPSESDAVEITGEREEGPTAALVGSQGNAAIGTVSQVPSDTDGNAVAGMGTIVLGAPIVAMSESTSGSTSAGDEVQEDAGGGVTGYSGATTQTTIPLGQVYTAQPAKYGFHYGDRVGVARYR